MNITNFLSTLDEQISSQLIEMGFEKFDNFNFVRYKTGHEINVLSVQKHSTEPKFCVNLGVHYDFIPKIGSTDLPNGNMLDISECEIKLRLTPEQIQNDYWWPADQNTIKKILNLISHNVELIFDRYDIDGPILKITHGDLESDATNILSSLTKVRSYLILANIHEFNGNTQKAIDFAKQGLKVAGMAVGPKKQFKRILKRL